MDKDKELVVIGEDVSPLNISDILKKYQSDITKMIECVESADPELKSKLLLLCVTFDGNWFDWSGLSSSTSMQMIDDNGIIKLFACETVDLSFYVDKEGNYKLQYHPEAKNRENTGKRLITDLDKTFPKYIKHFWDQVDKYKPIDIAEELEK